MAEEDHIDEVMARVRKLELKARRLAREVFSGSYLSTFRGQGLDFDDFRQYQHGDEIRFIDWNVTARMNEPFVRQFREERELSLILAVDVSGSVDFGSEYLSKREVAAEIAAVLGFSAVQNGDKVGLMLFAGEVLEFIPPAKGRKHLLRLIRDILIKEPLVSGTSFRSAASYLLSSVKKKSLVFMLSDFQADDLDRPIGKIAKKHDLVAVQVLDPLEEKLPKAGRVLMRDPETGFETLVNTNNPNLRMAYEKLRRRQLEAMEAIFKKHGIDYTKIATNEEIVPILRKLLKMRSIRRR